MAIPAVDVTGSTTADTLDILTITEARRAIGLSDTDTTQDTRLPSYITAVSRRIDSLVGPIVLRTITNEMQDGGLHYVELDYSPIASVTSVTEYAGTSATVLTASSNSSQPSNGYLLDGTPQGFYKGKIYRRFGNVDGYFPEGRQNVVITYVAGRYANTAAVDERYKRAAALTLASIFRKEQRPVSPGAAGPLSLNDTGPSPVPAFFVPYGAMELLVDEIMPATA